MARAGIQGVDEDDIYPKTKSCGNNKSGGHAKSPIADLPDIKRTADLAGSIEVLVYSRCTEC